MKPKGLAFTLIALGLSIGARPAHGQAMSFFRQFTTAGMDRATAVASDGSGVYVIGARTGGAGIRKYDSRGNVLWTREIGAPATGSVWPREVLADATGINVLGYASSSSGLPSQLLRKYSFDGDELWTRRLESDAPSDVAVDATGVYVASYVFAPNASYLRRRVVDQATGGTQ